MQPDTTPFGMAADTPKPDPTGQPTLTQDGRTVYREPWDNKPHVLGHFGQDKEKQES